MVLDDRTAIAADIEQSDSDANQTKSILDAAGAWSSRLRSETEAADVLQLLVDRVELRHDWIRLCIKLSPGVSEKLVGRGPTHLELTRLIPMQMRRRGVEMKFIVDGNSRRMSSKTEPALVKLVARAHRWFEDLVSGRAASMVEIGKREQIGKRHVSQIVRLAFLAPDIVEQIVNGVQPPELTARALLREIDATSARLGSAAQGSRILLPCLIRPAGIERFRGPESRPWGLLVTVGGALATHQPD